MMSELEKPDRRTKENGFFTSDKMYWEYDKGYNHAHGEWSAYHTQEIKKLADALKGIMKATPHSMCSNALAWAKGEQILAEIKGDK